jgi:hypothetical protein
MRARMFKTRRTRTPATPIIQALPIPVILLKHQILFVFFAASPVGARVRGAAPFYACGQEKAEDEDEEGDDDVGEGYWAGLRGEVKAQAAG